MTKRTSVETERQALALFEAALDQPSDNRSDWIKAQEPDADVLDRVLAMLRAHSAHQLRTGGAVADSVPAPMPERIGAYRITATIGSGGMGTAF